MASQSGKSWRAKTRDAYDGSAIYPGSYNNVGDVSTAQGDLAGALKSYRDGLAIGKKLAGKSPSNADWRRAICPVSFDKVSNRPKRAGQLVRSANESHRDLLAISEKLASQDPSNAGWQRDLSVRYDKVGDVLNAQGRLSLR